jgi:4-amino-4-deoxy-L-arabinose transferase-like glycosyltransferase
MAGDAEGSVIPFPGADSASPLPSILSDPRWHRALLLVFALLFIFTRLWETSLASYDDTYYAEKAKEILLTGEWLVPPWDYKPAFDNTPLTLWGMAAAFRLFGVSEFTARLLPGLAGVGCVLLTYHAGRRFFGNWVGFFAGAALLTTPYFLKYSRHAMLDTVQTLLVGGALILLVAGLERDRALGWDLAAGGLAGLAVLNKSVLGLLPFAIYFLHVAVTRPPWRRALRPGAWLALLLGLALPAVWFGAVTVRHGEAFLRQHFGYILWHRALHGDPGETVTWTSYLDYAGGLFSNFLPWILLALYGGFKVLREGGRRERRWLPVIWAAGTLGLMTLAAAKKSWYVLPAYPALAVLAGVGIDALLARRPWLRERYAAGLAALLLAAHLIAAATPVALGEDRNRDLKAVAGAARAAVPPGSHVINFNLLPPWKYVSPLYFYADRPLAAPETDLAVMQRIVTHREGAAILTDPPTYQRLSEALGHSPRILAASGGLILFAP